MRLHLEPPPDPRLTNCPCSGLACKLALRPKLLRRYTACRKTSSAGTFFTSTCRTVELTAGRRTHETRVRLTHRETEPRHYKKTGQQGNPSRDEQPRIRWTRQQPAYSKPGRPQTAGGHEEGHSRYSASSPGCLPRRTTASTASCGLSRLKCGRMCSTNSLHPQHAKTVGSMHAQE